MNKNVKTEMAMLPNGSYQQVVSPIQHRCDSTDYRWRCIEYGWELGRLRLQFEDGDPYEGGYEIDIDVKYCPFCGYNSEKK